ncbi:MAG: DUF4922 domain-containing protein [Mediterranea sp.]|jgi:hypothetical protein|nr:DUF4922 domain-containing protein [Mediterranea sp.]
MTIDIEPFFQQQCAAWPSAGANYSALNAVQTKELMVGQVQYRVQYNPGRITSSASQVDAESIANRPCFLCTDHLPSEQQTLGTYGHGYGHTYHILLNPYPIFPRHLTIKHVEHTRQLIFPTAPERLLDMLEFAEELPGYTIFYNGAKCGASAPDHFHFQVGNRGFMSIESQWRKLSPMELASFRSGKSTVYVLLGDLFRRALIVEGSDAGGIFELTEKVMHGVWGNTPEEPPVNLLAWYEGGRYTLCIIPRAAHRPRCYYAKGNARLLSSPGAVDLGGLFVLPRQEDFEKITGRHLAQILSEVCLYADYDWKITYSRL